MKRLLLLSCLTSSALIANTHTSAQAANEIPACLGVPLPKPSANTKTLDIYFNAQASLEKAGGIKVAEWEALPKCPKTGPKPVDCLPADYSSCLNASTTVSLSGHQTIPVSLPYVPMCSRQPVVLATGDISVFTVIIPTPGSACDALSLNDFWIGDLSSGGSLTYDPNTQTFSIRANAMLVQSAPFGTNYSLNINLPIAISRNSIQASGTIATGLDIAAAGVVTGNGSITVASPKQTLFSAAAAVPKATAYVQAAVSYLP